MAENGHHDHEHEHEDEHGHEHGEELTPEFEDLVHWLSEQSCVALEEEGEHASLVFLGFPDGGVKAQRFDATGQHDVDEAWKRVVTWARGVKANAVYFVGEAKRAEDEDAADGEEEDVLFFAALSAEGEEAAYETPFTRDGDGKVTLGKTEESSTAAVPFDEFRVLWGLPALEADSHDGPEPG